MKHIPLTRGLFAVVDDEDYDELAQRKWYARSSSRTFYATREQWVDGKKTTVHMHRVILKAPDGSDGDHIDGDGLNNRRSNLRLASRSQNLANRVHNTTNMSGYRGVSRCKTEGCWQATIKKDRKSVHIGCFRARDEAGRAYDAAALELFGEFARLNFPPPQSLKEFL